MKKVIFLFIIVFFIDHSVHAQYRVDKKKYDYQTYSHQPGDPYHPVVAGLASTVIPGMGQIISGETLRGLAFLGGVTGCLGIMIGVYSLPDKIIKSESLAQNAIMAIAFTGMAGIWFGSIIDAVHVAKVNNLAFRDRNTTSFDFQIQPYLKTSSITHNAPFQTGLTFKFDF